MSEQPNAVVGEMNEESGGQCPVAHERAPHPTQGGDNTGWWPKRLNLKILEIPIRYRDRTYGETNISRFRHGLLLLRMSAFAARKLKFL